MTTTLFQTWKCKDSYSFATTVGKGKKFIEKVSNLSVKSWGKIFFPQKVLAITLSNYQGNELSHYI